MEHVFELKVMSGNNVKGLLRSILNAKDLRYEYAMSLPEGLHLSALMDE